MVNSEKTEPPFNAQGIPNSLVELESELFESPSFATLSAGDVNKLLIKGIYLDKVAETATAITELNPESVSPDGLELAQKALYASKAIATQTNQIRAAFCEILNKNAIPILNPIDGNNISHLQAHCFSISVNPAHARQAAELAENEGFISWAPWTGGARECFYKTNHSLTMTKADGFGTRLQLSWASDSKRNKILELIKPGYKDFDLVKLPPKAWPLYYLVRPARIIIEKLFHLKPAHVPWPFLGTPESLINQLLDFSNVGPTDLLVDVGCGDGRLPVFAAKTRGCHAIGIERDESLATSATERIKVESLEDKVEIVCGDAENLIPDKADIVFLFLPMNCIANLIDTLKAKIKGEFRIIIHEQDKIDSKLKPDHSKAIFSDSAITVAHLWTIKR